MKKALILSVCLGWLLAAPALADPAATLARLEKDWDAGVGPASWRALKALEATPGRDRWPVDLQLRFCFQRARMVAIRHPDLARRNLDAAMSICETPRQRATVLGERCRLFEDGDALQQALSTYQASGASDPLLEAALAFDAGELAVKRRDPSEDGALHLLHAARLYESTGHWFEATLAWTQLAQFQDLHRNLAPSTLTRAETCAQRSNETRSWVALTSLPWTRSISARRNQRWLAHLRPEQHAQRALVMFRAALLGGDPSSWASASQEAEKSGDVDLELGLLQIRLRNTGASLEVCRPIYARAVRLLASRKAEEPSPCLRTAGGLAFWSTGMARKLQEAGEVPEAIAMAEQGARSLSGGPVSPEVVEAGCDLLELRLQAYRVPDCAPLTTLLVRRISELDSPRERLRAFFSLHRAMERGAEWETPTRLFGSRLSPDTLAGQNEALMLEDRRFLESLLRDTEAPELKNDHFNGAYRRDLFLLMGRPGQAVAEQQALPPEAGRPPYKTLRDLAPLQLLDDQPQAALESWERAAALAEPSDAFDSARDWVDASALCLKLKLNARALEDAQQGVRVAERLPQGSEWEGAPYSQLGQAEMACGHPDKAVIAFERAFDPRVHWRPHRERLAEALRAAGQRERAVAEMRGCLAELRKGALWNTQSELIAISVELARWMEADGDPAGALDALTQTAQSILQLRAESPEMSPRNLHETATVLESLSALLLRQGRSAEASGWLRKLDDLKLVQQQQGRRDDPEALKLQQAQGNLAMLEGQLGAAKASDRERLEQRQAEERRKFTDTLEHLRSRFPEYDRLASLRATEVPDTQALLQEDVVALQMFATDEGVYLMALTRQRRFSTFTRVPRSELRKAVDSYLRAVSSGETSPAAEELSQWLVAPVLDLLADKRVLWLPSGELSQIPLDLLPVHGGRLGDHAVVSHVYAGDLTAGRRQGQQLLALGAATGVDLPGTVDELKVIETLFPQHLELEGDNASMARLIQAAPTCDILHLASHAGGDPEHPETDYLELARQKLGISEILNLNLRPGSLVFLSACRSGVASAAPVTDVNSLANAFRAAGAGAVVYTLWPIDDQGAVELVRHFYTELRAGRSAAQSLALAKIEMRKTKFSDPRYWGAFQVIGKDW